MPQIPKPAHMYADKQNSSHISARRIEQLKNSTVKIGEKEFVPPNSVVNNAIAFCKWCEIMELYRSSTVDIVTSADVGLLERYCLSYEEYLTLIHTRYEIMRKSDDIVLNMKTCNAMKIDSKLNQKNTLLLKMESELFLTPLSKSRAIPRTNHKANKNEDELQQKGFDL